MKTLLILLLRGYQYCISPLLGQSCRFYPSCSNYAMEALREHGALKGAMLAAVRLGKCHPWHPGGVDPVPGKTAKKDAKKADGHTLIPQPLAVANIPEFSKSLITGSYKNGYQTWRTVVCVVVFHNYPME